LAFLERTPGLLTRPADGTDANDGNDATAAADASAPATPRPLLLYLFSNGGVFVYEQLAAMLYAQRNGTTTGHVGDSARASASAPASATAGPHAAFLAAHVGTLFDSAPCYIKPAFAADLFAQMAPFSFLRPLFAAFFRFQYAFLGAALAWCGADSGPDRAGRFWDVLQACPSRVPEAYLYSADDPLCDVAELERLISAREDVTKVPIKMRWEVSQHVGHLRCHGEAYERAVREFIAATTAPAARK
jgi:hypothetical protein